MKGKMKGFGLYLIILVFLLAGVSYVVSQTQQTETLSYNQIYNYFMDGDVDQYDVDDTTLTMHLKKENQTYTYDLGDYRSVFYNDLGETIQQQMRDGTLTKVVGTVPAVCDPDRAADRVLVLYDEQAVRRRSRSDAVWQGPCKAGAGR